MRLDKNIKIIINYFLGPLIFLALCYTIYQQLSKQHNLPESVGMIRRSLASGSQWKLWLVIFLMFLNWVLEAKKWQYCNQQFQVIPMKRAIQAVLAGIAVASFTPNRVGEYFGRILYVPAGNRGKTISLTMVGSMAQFLVTILFGGFGLLYLEWYLRNTASPGHPFLHLSLTILLIGVALTLIIMFVLYFRLHWLVRWIEGWDRNGKIINYVKVVREVPLSALSRILFLSFIRYLVFIIQYGLLFSLFGVVLNVLQLFAGIAVMFLIMAVVPTFSFLTDLGIRWEASIQIMELFSGNTIGIFTASFGIWIINLILPALIGSLLILRIKIFRLDENH
jgi:MFS family permease